MTKVIKMPKTVYSIDVRPGENEKPIYHTFRHEAPDGPIIHIVMSVRYFEDIETVRHAAEQEILKLYRTASKSSGG